MRKILFIHPKSGEKQLAKVDSATGGLSSDCVILWDEKVDGAFPSNLVADAKFLVRSGNTLSVDQQAKSAYQAAQLEQSTNEQNRKAVLKAAKNISNLADAKTVILAMIEHMGADK